MEGWLLGRFDVIIPCPTIAKRGSGGVAPITDRPSWHRTPPLASVIPPGAWAGSPLRFGVKGVHGTIATGSTKSGAIKSGPV